MTCLACIYLISGPRWKLETVKWHAVLRENYVIHVVTIYRTKHFGVKS